VKEDTNKRNAELTMHREKNNDVLFKLWRQTCLLEEFQNSTTKSPFNHT